MKPLSSWQPSENGGWNCHTCGSHTNSAQYMRDIEYDCTKCGSGNRKTKSRKTFGPLCLELAETHLHGNGIEVTEQDCHDLAQAIQDAIDDWFTGKMS